MSMDAVKSEINQQKVDAVLGSLTIPSEIERWDARFGTDSTGDPAAWITFHVRPDVTVDNKKLTELNKFLSEVTRKLLQDNADGFPYTILTQAA
jgi:hypothetical protein